MVQDDSGEFGPRAFPYGKTVSNGTNCLIKEANSTFACCWKNLPCPHLPLLIHTYFLGSPFSLQSKKMPPASPPFQLSLGSSDSPAHGGDEDSSRCHSPWDRGDTGVRGGSQLWSQPRLQQAAFQTSLWGTQASAVSKRGTPLGSRNCADCSSRSVELPAGHGVGSEHISLDMSGEFSHAKGLRLLV